MNITTKNANWGYALLALALIIFVGYWYILLEPTQLKMIEAGKHPSLIGTILVSILVSSVLATLTYVGGTLGGFAWLKWAKQTELTFKGLIQSVAFRNWLIWFNVLWLLFSLIWRSEI